MGSKITKLQPVGGFAAETGAAWHSSRRPVSGSRSARLTPSRDRSLALARRCGCRGAVGDRRPYRLGMGHHDPGSAFIGATRTRC
jgi:hypothetical protein